MDTRQHIRLAAIGDLHVGATGGMRDFSELFAGISAGADVLALCGDLTHMGTLKEAERLCSELAACTIPMVGILGNHDHESGHAREITHALRNAGVQMLEQHTQEVAGIGFAGVKGFGGGFGAHTLGRFGEQAIKAFVDEAVREAMLLENALHELRHLRQVVVVLHYAPVWGTCVGEPPEIAALLGTSRLEEVIDRFPNVVAVVHGHSHQGTYAAKTAAGIAVYNCAASVAKPDGKPYAIIKI